MRHRAEEQFSRILKLSFHRLHDLVSERGWNLFGGGPGYGFKVSVELISMLSRCATYAHSLQDPSFKIF